MTYLEAMLAMQQGHPVTRDAWDDGDGVKEFLFIRPEFELRASDLPIIKSIPDEVKRLIKREAPGCTEIVQLSSTLCHYKELHVINGFIPSQTDRTADDWRRVYH